MNDAVDKLNEVFATFNAAKKSAGQGDARSNLMAKKEFELSEVLDFITIRSGRDPKNSSDYKDKLLASIKETLEFDIDTTVYKRAIVDDQLVMKREPGRSLISRQALEKWVATHSGIIDKTKRVPTKNGRPYDSWANFSRLTSNYLTKQDLEKLARKPSLHLEEAVQLIHLTCLPQEKMSEDMLDTYDTLNRQIVSKYGKPASDYLLYPAREILTVAAQIGYPIPVALIHWVQLPIDGLNWPKQQKAAEVDSEIEQIRSTEYWQSLEAKALEAVKEFPEWSKKQRKIQLTGNLQDWLKRITGNTREAEIIKNLLTELFDIN